MRIFLDLKNNIAKNLKKENYAYLDSLKIERPLDLNKGDWRTNFPLILAGKMKKNPEEIAQKIKEILEQKLEELGLEKIEIQKPGYLNFYLSEDYFKGFLKKEKIEVENENKKILFEHTSPNLFKPLHIGHLVTNSIGESLSRVLEFFGNQVTKVSFPSDVSLGIAKTVWALKKQEISLEDLDLHKIAQAYVKGTAEYKEKPEIQEEVKNINKKIYQFLNGEIDGKYDLDILIYQRGKEISLNHLKEIAQKLGSKFDDFIFESEAEKIGKEIVLNNLGKVFKESEGAIIFEGKEYTNVFINSQGYGTYLTKDIGLLKIKKGKYPEAEKSLVVVDIEQKKHFEMVVEAGSQIDEIKDFVEKSIYLNHGRMNFAGKVKISSRYGNVPLVIDLIEKIKSIILEKMSERDFGKDEKEDIAEKLAIGTLKYTILKVKTGKNLVFDIEKDINPQGNTLSYLMYSRVRALSVLRKMNKFDDFKEIENSVFLRKLTKMEEILIEVKEDLSPHHLVNYLYDLASEFNNLYTKIKFLESSHQDFYYFLIRKYLSTMDLGFKLLGIEKVDKM